MIKSKLIVSLLYVQGALFAMNKKDLVNYNNVKRNKGLFTQEERINERWFFIDIALFIALLTKTLE